MKIGFTGTQHGISIRQKEILRQELSLATEFHHGDCIGADEEAHEIARELELYIVVHPPKNYAKRAWCTGDVTLPERDYLERNHLIVDHTDKLIGCSRFNREELRSGTWSTIRYAKRIGKPYVVILPNDP
jgi:hypothetical protein